MSQCSDYKRTKKKQKKQHISEKNLRRTLSLSLSLSLSVSLSLSLKLLSCLNGGKGEREVYHAYTDYCYYAMMAHILWLRVKQLFQGNVDWNAKNR